MFIVLVGSIEFNNNLLLICQASLLYLFVFNFRVSPDVIMWGMIFSLIVGIIGGFLPARRAASVRLIDVLRQ